MLEVAHSMTFRALFLSTPHNRRFEFRSLVSVHAVFHIFPVDDFGITPRIKLLIAGRIRLRMPTKR
jgi:hypothetical protein